MRVSVFLASLVAGALASAATGCGTDPDGDCAEFLLDLECTPQYEPTFDNIFTNSIAPSCAPPGTACHAAAGARGGLIFEDADQSFDLLTGAGADVVPMDPCGSELGRRVTSSASNVQMPPGAPLSAGEQCAILQWIEDGAQR